jgi:hypothetical protein
MKYITRLRIAWTKTHIVNKLTFLLTLVIAGANMAYVFYARKQFITMSGQLAQMQSSSGQTDKLLCLYRQQVSEVARLADSSARQAAISQKALNSSRQQFQLDQRPYVVIDHLALVDFDTRKIISQPIVGRPIAANVYFKNSGKTPALNTKTHRHLLFGDDNMIKLHPEPIDSAKGGVVMAQGTPGDFVTALSVENTYAVEGSEITSPVVNWDGRYPVVVFGRVTYQDSAGTRYCTPYFDQLLSGGAWQKISKVTIDHKVRNLVDLCTKMRPF